MTASAIQQAIDLLVGRLHEARERHSEVTAEAAALTDEIASIEDAVRKLAPANPDAPSACPEVMSYNALNGAPVPSIRSAVKAILDERPLAYTTPQLRHRLPDAVTDGKTDQQISNGVRSAVWSLTTKGDAVRLENDTDRMMSTKWREHTLASPEFPADSRDEAVTSGQQEVHF